MTDRKPDWTVLLLSLMMVMVPAMGAPTEEMLQDTLKSIAVASFALAASFTFFWRWRAPTGPVKLHVLLGLPLALMTYALASMAWSHAYLGGVEAIRWFIFSLILFLGMNTLTPPRVTQLVWGIHLGAVLAALWAALQFWFDFSVFPQGPNPASTFVNRNFFGEFIVCTFPFSALLLMRVKDKTSVFLLTFSLGFTITALMMTGTRSALVGLMLLALLVPGIMLRYRKQFASSGWRVGHGLALPALLIGTVLALGAINTANPQLMAESGPGDALDRAFSRTLSMAKASEYSEGSFSIRAAMWKATGRMILAHPVTGVGAGAWEVQSPLYQVAGSQLETDYYAHNEILQLVAEYGLAGWLFLLCLVSYLLSAAYRTWTNRSEQGRQEAPLRSLTLASLLVFLLVSNAGFPWRMASTGALFAVCLSILAASDARLANDKSFWLHSTPWKQRYSLLALALTAIATGLALYIAQQATLCESRIVRAVKIAMTINNSGKPTDPGWTPAKTEMLQLIREGIAINPHYRKLTPIVADSLASWGDWKNATWIWESVIASRPNVVAMLANVTRGHMQANNMAKAAESFDRAKHLQPDSPTVAFLEVMLWSRTGKNLEAAARAKELLKAGTFDSDLVRTAYYLGMRNRDAELAILALEVRIKTWPNQAVDGWIKLGEIYDAPEAKDERRALQAYRAAVQAADATYKSAVLAQIPPIYRAKIN